MESVPFRVHKPAQQDLQMNAVDQIFDLSPAIRYVALYRSKHLSSRQRKGLSSASASESDRYEELLVNPALLTLARQRGEIDCGGARFVLVGYGHFHQLVVDLPDGHASVCFEPGSNPLDHVEHISRICLDQQPEQTNGTVTDSQFTENR